MTLKDLPGRPGLTRAEFVKSRTAAMKYLRLGKTVTSAGNNGAINIWREKGGGILHATFNRNCVQLRHLTCPTLAGLNSWLRSWWPEMGRIG